MLTNLLKDFKFPLIFASVIFIAGCASTAQQVGSNKYRVDCSGMMSSKSACYAAAETTCGQGKFTEIEFRIDDRGDVYDAFCNCYIWVIKRNLTFSCRA
jgi:hypothetical protein